MLAIVGLMLGCGDPRSGDSLLNQGTFNDGSKCEIPTPPGAVPMLMPTLNIVVVKIATWDEIETTVASHQGKVVVVDLWSTSCVPCLRELPKLAELQQQFPKTVACISVNLDYIGAVGKTPESYLDKVIKSLEDSSSAVQQNFLSSTSDADVYEKIKLAAVPAVLVYDRMGKLLKRFDNDMNDYGEDGFTYADHINPLVKQTLSEPQ